MARRSTNKQTRKEVKVSNPFLRIKGHKTFKGITEVEIRPRDLGKAYTESKRVVNYTNSRNSSKWIGESDSRCQDLCEIGDIKQVEASQEFAKQVDKKLDVETCAPEMMDTVAGGAASVPAYLAGNPNCFRRPKPVQDTRKPLRIFVDVGVSAGIDQDTIQKRGRALLAMAQILSKSRPVEIVAFFYGEISRHEYLVKVPLRLDNWATVGAVIGNGAFLREPLFRFMIEAAGETSLGRIGWGERYEGESGTRELLGAKRNDVIFGRAFLDNRKLNADPVQWVADEIERINKEQKA